MEWEKSQISNFLDSISITYNFKGKESVVFLNTSDIYNGKVINRNYCNVINLPGQAKKAINKGDILFSEIRPINRRFAFIDFDSEDYVVSTKLMVLRKKSKIVDQKYLIKYLTSEQTLTELQLLAESRSGTFPQITFDVLGKVKIPLPPLPEQKAIADILSSLDDKIELNYRMNKTLEQMARAIFKRWFGDFEFPLTEGAGYKSSGGKMVESELGMIPDGWRIGTLIDEFNIIMGQSPPGSTYNEDGMGIPFFQGRADFEFRFPKTRMYCTEPKRFAQKFNTLVSVRAPVGDMNIAIEDCCIGRGLAAVIHKDNHYSYTYYKLLSLMDQFKNYESNGTVFGSINKNQFEGMKVIIPKQSLIKEFDRIVNALDDKIYNLTKQNQTLTDLRDALLPKLISGEIRVKDAEKFVESKK